MFHKAILLLATDNVGIHRWADLTGGSDGEASVEERPDTVILTVPLTYRNRPKLQLT